MRRRLLFGSSGGGGSVTPSLPKYNITFNSNGYAFEVKYTYNGSQKTQAVQGSSSQTITLEGNPNTFTIDDVNFNKVTNPNVLLKFRNMKYNGSQKNLKDTLTLQSSNTIDIGGLMSYTIGLWTDCMEQITVGLNAKAIDNKGNQIDNNDNQVYKNVNVSRGSVTMDTVDVAFN